MTNPKIWNEIVTESDIFHKLVQRKKQTPTPLEYTTLQTLSQTDNMS